MKRVASQQFLYERGGVYWFRRAVPEAARGAFGGRLEVQISLRTRTLSEARHRLNAHLKDFDQRLAQSTGRPDPTLSPASLSTHLEPVEIDAAVRLWLRDRLHREAITGVTTGGSLSVSPEEVGATSRRQDLALSSDIIKLVHLQGGDAQLNTRWIAQAICEANGWFIGKGSPTETYLLRMVGRAQREFSQQAISEMNGDPVQVGEAVFAGDQYLLDQKREAKRPSGPPVRITALFTGYAAERKPKPATVKAWKRLIGELVAHLGHDDARKVTPHDIVDWKDKLLAGTTRSGTPRSARTVRETYLASARAVFRWAVENRKLDRDPTAGIKVRGAEKPRLRTEKGLTNAEATTILAAAQNVSSSRRSAEHALARRWVPWLCAYTGARVNEITQLRAEDVAKVDEVWTIRITPEAGAVKNNRARVVPLHAHLIEQGFIKLVEKKQGPLFYDPVRHRGGSEGNPQFKKVGERLAAWVRELGVDDPEVAPNHGWRHRFKTVARSVGMDPETRDAIQGHRPRTEGEEYGEIPVAVLARAIEMLPRYDTSPPKA